MHNSHRPRGSDAEFTCHGTDTVQCTEIGTGGPWCTGYTTSSNLRANF